MAQEFIQNHGENAIINELSLTKMTEPDDVAPTVILTIESTKCFIFTEPIQSY